MPAKETTSHKRVDELFDLLLASPPEQRPELLREQADGDQNLMREVADLMRLSDRPWPLLDELKAQRDGILSGLMSVDLKEALAEEGDRSGQVVGGYRLAEAVGQGAKAFVYRGRKRDEGWQLEAAVKVLKRGVDTDDVLRRFLAERHILTLLDHPRIASILDAGTTGDGLPWFAMEWVDGWTVTDYCRRQRLGLAARLRLFLDIASAVEYAHRHLIVHRDLKPSNVLVNRQGHVKLLDFGIAKVLDPGAASGLPLPLTITEVSPRTPDYASPEQVEGRPVTTATDVYQLGLLLYEMLSGERPPVRARAGGDFLLPPPPSRAARKEAACVESDSRERFTAALRGDLDTIVLKALRPEPAERYRSVRALEEDLRRHLSHRPIGARPASAAYRLGKFMRRHRWAVPSGVLLALVLAGFLSTLMVSSARIVGERDRAERIKDFLVSFLRAPDPFQGEGSQVTIQAAMAGAVIQADEDFADDPALRTEIWQTAATVYENLGLHEENRELVRRLLEEARRNEDAGSLRVLALRRRLALAQGRSGEPEVSRRELKSVSRELQDRFPDEFLEQAQALYAFAQLERDYGDIQEAADALEEASDLLARPQGGPGEVQARVMIDLANAYNVLDQPAKALQTITQGIAALEEFFGTDSLQAATARMDQATTYSKLNRYQEAAETYDRYLEVLDRRLGALHPSTIASYNNLAVNLDRLGDPRAIDIHRQVLDRKRQTAAGEASVTVAVSLLNLGSALTNHGQFREAIEVLHESGRLYRELVDPDSYRHAFVDLNLAMAHRKSGDTGGMEDAARRAHLLCRKVLPEGHLVREIARCQLGWALNLQGRFEEGGPLARAALHSLSANPNTPAVHLENCRQSVELLP